MGEKRYYLTEVEEGTLIASHFKLAITESELWQRLTLATSELTREVPDYNEAVDILLHGEGKDYDEYINEHRHSKKEQPDLFAEYNDETSKAIWRPDLSKQPQPSHSVYTHCWDCDTWGINLPGDTACGNCGSTETTEYHPRLDEPLVEPKEQSDDWAEPEPEYTPEQIQTIWDRYNSLCFTIEGGLIEPSKPDPEDILKMRGKEEGDVLLRR